MGKDKERTWGFREQLSYRDKTHNYRRGVCVREKDLRYDKMKNVINLSAVLSLALESYTSVIPNCLT